MSSETIQALPVGQEYRDLLKLIPGVAVTQDSTRGQSAGGSGQDNVYKFDGVNVTLPLFGTLSAEPASYDIAEVTTVKGGAKAVDFVRAAGFTVDTISKSGTNRFAGQVSYQYQGANMAADVQSGSASKYNQTLSWFNTGVGGPVIPGKLFFYGSYYRPERSRDNRSNLYGELPDYNSTRNEGYGKLTYSPTSQILINGSYRYSHRLDKSDLFGQASSATTGTGYESQSGDPDRWTARGSSIRAASRRSSSRTSRTRTWAGRTTSANTNVNTAIGTRLDLANLDKIGLLTVPVAAHRPGRGERVLPAVYRPVRVHLADTASEDRRRHRRLRHLVRQRRLLPDVLAGRVQRELRVHDDPRSSTSGTSTPATGRNCSGVRTGGARSRITGRPDGRRLRAAAAAGRSRTSSRRSSSRRLARCRRSSRPTSRRASR